MTIYNGKLPNMTNVARTQAAYLVGLRQRLAIRTCRQPYYYSIANLQGGEVLKVDQAFKTGAGGIDAIGVTLRILIP